MKKNFRHLLLFILLFACQPDQELSDLVVNQPPSVPVNLTVTARTTSSLSIEWDNSTDTDGSIVQYRIYLDGSFNSISETASATIQELDAETEFSIQISAIDDDNTESALSEAVTSSTLVEEDILPPSVPEASATSQLTPTSMTLNWQASTDNQSTAIRYEIQLRNELLGTTGQTTFSVSNLTPGTEYTFEIRAIDEAGNSSDPLEIVVSTPDITDTEAPSTPANLSAVNTDVNSTELNWEASTDNVGVIAYKVYQDGTEITIISTTTFTVEGLTGATSYSFAVSAIDMASNESALSNTISITTAAPSDTEAPSTPSNLSAANTDTDSTDLSWDASTDNVGVTGYKVYQDGTEITEVAGTSFSVTGLSSSTTYSFEVSAVDAAGNESSRSTALSVTTDAAVTSERVLVFSKTEGFRHGSISDGQTALSELAAANNFTVEFSEDSNDFTSGNLALYDLVIFLNTTGDILNSTQEAAFEGYIQAGGAFMGIHSATDTEYDWAWYGGLVGAYFANHPSIQTADVQVMGMHPSINHLGSTWTRNDEWYNFQQLSTDITPVLNLDESSYSGGTMGSNHPIAWYQIYDGGRSFYTGMGHTNASYSESDFRQHLLGGILWCLNR